jgi:hypothetical protein
MTLMELPRSTDRLSPRTVSPDQHMHDVRRVLLDCKHADFLSSPTQGADKTILIQGITAVATDAGFKGVEVHFVEHGPEIGMEIIVSNKSGIIWLTVSKQRPGSLDLFISCRGETSYCADRCCELMRIYFDGEGILLS